MSMYSKEQIEKSKKIALEEIEAGRVKDEYDRVRYKYMIKIGPPIPLIMVEHERVSTDEKVLEVYKQCLKENKTWEEVLNFKHNSNNWY